MTRHVVVVGASVAGMRVVEGLREGGFTGALSLVGKEDLLPYDRPPLSKEALTAEEIPNLDLASPEWYKNADVELILGQEATSVDLEQKMLRIGEREVQYDELVVATGARPRNPFESLPEGVMTLRTLDDALALRKAIDTADRVAIIGGGFIGLEVASAVRSKGKDATVVEVAAIPLGRIIGPEAATRIGDIAQAHGVELKCGVGVDGFIGGSRLSGLILSDGSTLECETAVLGVGAIPNTEWLDGSDLRVEPFGLICDETGRAAPGVWGVGDATTWLNSQGEPERHEHWTSAHNQARVVALNILDGGTRRIEVADYVWSDQFGKRITVAGNTRLFDELAVREGEDGEFAVLYALEGTLVGACVVGQPRLAMQCRLWIAQQASVSNIDVWQTPELSSI